MARQKGNGTRRSRPETVATCGGYWKEAQKDIKGRRLGMRGFRDEGNRMNEDGTNVEDKFRTAAVKVTDDRDSQIIVRYDGDRETDRREDYGARPPPQEKLTKATIIIHILIMEPRSLTTNYTNKPGREAYRMGNYEHTSPPVEETAAQH